MAGAPGRRRSVRRRAALPALPATKQTQPPKQHERAAEAPSPEPQADTPYRTPTMTTPVFDAAQTARVTPFAELVDALRTAALDADAGRIESPARLVVPLNEGGVMLSMPASARRTAEPQNRRTAEPPNRRTAEPPNRRTAEPPSRRAAEPPSRRTAEPQNRRTAEPQWPCNIEKSGAAGSSGGASRGTGAWPGRRAGVDPFDGARRCLRYRQQSKPSHPSNTNARPKPHHPNPRPTRPTGHPR
ncbi:ornithine cyclodeaminase [Burkholderia pseudomallei]|nr:ornithine cyclodeaminase [Burkholderia pseudomallei]